MSAAVESNSTQSPDPDASVTQISSDSTSNFLFTLYYNTGGSNFRSAANPTICYYANNFHAFMKGRDNYNVYHYVSQTGDNFRPAQQNPLGANIATSAGPSAIEYKGTLHLFFRDAPNRSLVYHVKTTDFKTWDYYSPGIGISPDDNFSLAVNTENNTLCLVCQDKGGYGVMSAVFNGSDWETSFTGATTAYTPGLLYDGSSYYCYYVDGASDVNGLDENGYPTISNPFTST
jgi:hypothetical protein